MTELEKILQEIGYAVTGSIGKKREGMIECMDIIQKHVSENKCSECSRRKFYQLGYEDGKKEIESASDEFLEECKRVAEKYKKHNDGWTAVEDILPEAGENVLVWYEYFRYGDYNCMYQTYGIGYQYDGHWSGDVSGRAATCIAWRPLPKPYKPLVESKEGKRMREREEFFKDGE